MSVYSVVKTALSFAHAVHTILRSNHILVDGLLVPMSSKSHKGVKSVQYDCANEALPLHAPTHDLMVNRYLFNQHGTSFIKHVTATDVCITSSMSY